MGKIIELEQKVITVTTQDIVDDLLSQVEPGVLASEIDSVGFADDGSFIEIILAADTTAETTNTRIFQLTKADLISDMISQYDASLTEEMINLFEIDEDVTTNVNIGFNPEQVATY